MIPRPFYDPGRGHSDDEVLMSLGGKQRLPEIPPCTCRLLLSVHPAIAVRRPQNVSGLQPALPPPSIRTDSISGPCAKH